MKSLRAIAVLLAVAACVALAGAALASKGSKPARQLPHSTKVHKAKPLAKQVSRAPVSSKSGQSAGDTDNIQSGDQTTSDQPGEQSSESESSSDNEAGQAGEPAQGQGHEDPAGQDSNHECTGNCQE
jgi:hypothetical protein